LNSWTIRQIKKLIYCIGSSSGIVNDIIVNDIIGEQSTPEEQANTALTRST
jgi:hypothetical protein